MNLGCIRSRFYILCKSRGCWLDCLTKKFSHGLDAIAHKLKLEPIVCWPVWRHHSGLCSGNLLGPWCSLLSLLPSSIPWWYSILKLLLNLEYCLCALCNYEFHTPWPDTRCSAYTVLCQKSKEDHTLNIDEAICMRGSSKSVSALGKDEDIWEPHLNFG